MLRKVACCKICFIISLLILSCNKDKLYSEVNALIGNGVIEIDSSLVSGNIGTIFSKYVYIEAPNGKRISVFGTSGVSNDQMLYAKEILETYLKSDGFLYNSKTKEIIANSMSNKKAALVFFDSEQQFEDNISKIESQGYNFQDLYATESLNSGNRDASYEEILHLVHNYGIAPTLFELENRIQKANDAAIASGLWIPWESDGLPKSDFNDEYFAALMDCYLGLWEQAEGTFNGAYKLKSKEEMRIQDPEGYKIIQDLFGDIKTVR